MKKKFNTKEEAYKFWEEVYDKMMGEDLKDNYQHYINRVEEVDGKFIVEWGKQKI